MRRPHRSIETFDISLMAVVTKAMGAFLVLMLLLMPYYKSGPIGQQAADDLAKKVEQIDKKIRDVIENLNTSNAEDLRKKLEEALVLLEEARRLIAELKRANDALQAQVRRLEEEVGTLQARVASLQSHVAQLERENAALKARIPPLEQENAQLKEDLSKFTGNKMIVIVTNVECAELVVVQIYSPDTYVSSSSGQRITDVLNFSGARSRDIVRARNFTLFSTGGFSPGPQYLVARLQKVGSSPEKLKNGMTGSKLTSATADCSIQAGLSVDFSTGRGFSYPLRRIQIRKGDYAVFIGELAVKEDDADWLDAPSEAATAWFANQVKNAEKAE